MNPNDFDVIIVDQKMPYVMESELVQEIKERGITGKIALGWIRLFNVVTSCGYFNNSVAA